MRCQACNKELNDSEATRKTPEGAFIDLCGECNSVSVTALYEDKDLFKWDLGLTELTE
jgi:hypothetical protein